MNSEVMAPAGRLTEMVSCAGCAAKLAPSDLARILGGLAPQSRENVLVGYENADDAGVFRLTDETAIVQTVDFFPPVADDPFVYGQIAANNAINDVYAMGGTPISALSIVCFPQKGDLDILARILSGGQAMMAANNVVVLGGHSIDDAEIKFGYAVTGIIRPQAIFTNGGAVAGDKLILTKPIGTGAINTAVKYGKASPATAAAAINIMTRSSAEASKLMRRVGAHACTDVTGFGLLGHAFEMAKASSATLAIDSSAVPMLAGVIDLIGQGMLTRGDKNNRVYAGETVNFSSRVSGAMQSALFDPQTAGGLLISLPESAAAEFISEMPDASVIGHVERQGEYLIEVS